MKKLIRSPIFWGIVITPFVMYIAFWSGPEIHGNYFVARLLLPYACLAMRLGDPIAMWTALFALIQFAAYGWLVSGPHWRRSGAILLVIHLVLVVMLFGFPFN